jgi:hypothetical protein
MAARSGAPAGANAMASPVATSRTPMLLVSAATPGLGAPVASTRPVGLAIRTGRAVMTAP